MAGETRHGFSGSGRNIGEEVPEALRLLGSRKTYGKLVTTPGG
jgi:hypothetical protein